METETLPHIETRSGLPVLSFTDAQVKLIRDTVAKGTDDNEFALFLYTAKHLGLNPLLRQIHAVKRWDSKLEREAMAIQVGIDGLRLNAERTKRYAPGREPSFVEGKDGKPVSATAYVKKFIEGEWHEIAATAYYAEYVQTKKDGTPNAMWERMPHSQLAKCAESLALRKGFPNETSGVRTDEEMAQSENFIEGTATREAIKEPEAKQLETKQPEATPAPPTGDIISEAQSKRFFAIAMGAGKTKGDIISYCGKLGISRSSEMLKADYDAACAWAGAK